MPLVNDKSKDAFQHNVKAEIGSGKPPKQAVAIAYSMRKKAANMAEGGTVDAMSHAASIAHAILESKKGYADGGEIEEAPRSSSDFLSSDADTSLKSIENAHLPVDNEAEIEGMGESRKKMLKGIMASIKSR